MIATHKTIVHLNNPTLYVCGLLLLTSLTGCARQQEDDVVRVGYFPNITHAQALVGLADGTFQDALGQEVTIEPKIFNAGPEEIEALFAGEIDLGYIGPSPAINGSIQSQGEALKIIAGAMSGGVALVLQPELAADFATRGAEALRGKKLASPQQGNTQDISLRNYLKQNGLENDVQVVPMASADQLTVFAQKQLDGSWSPEPWASRLVQEAGGVIVLDERDLWPNNEFATTVLIASTEFIQNHPDRVQPWIEAHQQVTNWIIANSNEAQTIVNTEIEKLTGKKLDPNVLASAWEKMQPNSAILFESIAIFEAQASYVGFLELNGEPFPALYDPSFIDATNNATSN